MTLFNYPLFNKRPNPKSVVPQLLLTTVKFFVPASFNALMLHSGIPHNPNPPTKTVAPAGIYLMIERSFIMRT
jgi:hypothetical protein